MTTKQSRSADMAVLRKLGINEAYQLAMYLLDQYRGTVLSCRYEIPPHLAPAESQTRLEEAVKVAVVDIIMRHPMMQVGIIHATSKKPSWIQLQSLDLTQHINWVHLTEGDDFERTVQETFRARLDGSFPDLSTKQPGWWMTIIRQGAAPCMEVLLTWNHPQFDAMGAKVIHEDLLEMLNNSDSSGVHERTSLMDGDVLELPQAAPLLPDPIESLNRLPVDLSVLVKAFWEEIRPAFIARRDPTLAAWSPIHPSAPYITQYRAFFIDQTLLSAILALCRQNKTTITALIHGLALLAFSSHLASTVAPAFQSSTIVDHRRNLPPAPPNAPWGTSDRAVSNYVTQAFHRYEPDLVQRIRSKLSANEQVGGDALSADLQRELWDVAARDRRDIVRKLEVDGLRNDLVGTFKYVSDWKQTMKNQATKTRQFTWLVTNIGVLKNNTTGDDKSWSMSRAQFGLSAEIPAAAIEFSPVSVAGRGMCVGANWSDDAMGTALGDRIMASLEKWLTQLGR